MAYESQPKSQEKLGKRIVKGLGAMAAASALGLGVNVAVAELSPDAPPPETAAAILTGAQRKQLDRTAGDTAKRILYGKGGAAPLEIRTDSKQTTIIGSADGNPHRWHTLGLTFNGTPEGTELVDVRNFINRQPSVSRVAITRGFRIPSEASDIDNPDVIRFSFAITKEKNGAQRLNTVMPAKVIRPADSGYADLSGYTPFERAAAIADGIRPYWHGLVPAAISSGEEKDLLPPHIPAHRN